MKNIVILIFGLICLNTVNAQERKLRKTKELIFENRITEADAVVSELLLKYPTMPPVLYFSSLIDLQLNRSLDSIYQKVKFGNKNLINLRYVNNHSDSVDLGFTKEEFQKLKSQIEDFAFNRYYKNASSIDSLELFKEKFDARNLQIQHIDKRVCEIASKFALNSNDITVLRDFVINHKNCVEINLVRAKIEEFDWRLAKKYNTYKSYELFSNQYPVSIYKDSVSYALECLDWASVLYKDSLQLYKAFASKYPNSKFTVIAVNKIDTLQWLPVSSTGSLSDLENFVRLYPKSNFIRQAKDSIVKLEWFAIALTEDLDVVGRFLDKFPKSAYENYALKRQDDLLWSKYDKSAKDLEEYLGKCRLCKYEDVATEKLSVFSWNQIKNTQDTVALNGFISRFPASSKLKDAIAARDQVRRNLNIVELKKIFSIISRDSVETESYLVKQAPFNSAILTTAKNGDKTINILDQVFKSPNMEVCDCPENQYYYAGYSKIFQCHVVLDQESYIDYDYLLIDNDGNINKLSSSYRNFADLVMSGYDEAKLIAVEVGGDAIVGFRVVSWKKGEIDFSVESNYFDFGTNGGIERIYFLKPNLIKVNAFIYGADGNAKPFEADFVFDYSLKVWKHLKK